MKQLLTIFLVCSVSFIFGQTENFWTKKSDFAGLKRERAVAFSANGFGFVGTGIDTAEIVHNDFWKYDAALDSWSQVASLPGSERRNAIAFSIGDYGYVGTGISTVNSSDPGSTKLSDLWEYNAVTNAWIQKSDFPGFAAAGIYFATAFTVGNKGYLCGGKLGPNNYSDQLWEYDPTTDTWTQRANFPGGVRYQLSSFAIDDKGYVGLGTDQDLYRRDIWQYKPASDQWIERAELPGSERSTAATFTIGHRGFVCMGTNGGMLDDLWMYNPTDDSWFIRATYGGSPRKGAVAFVIGNKAYVGTGKGYSGKKASMHEYTPPMTLGLEELNIELAVYPNPATHIIQFESSFPFERIELRNTNGQLIQSAYYTSKMDVSSLSSGVYFAQGTTMDGQSTLTQKIIIQ